jgi:hypothetical protein
MAESNYSGTSQLAGLVKAATAAADQEVEWSYQDAASGSAPQLFEGDDSHAAPGNLYMPLHSGQYDPRVRNSRDIAESEALSQPYTRKRKKGISSTGAEEPVAEEQAAVRETSQQSPLSRTQAGIHSAAALFRAPSTSSKKYTRPPMSKLFSSLRLLPEDFLHLQSAAKAYMLDEGHPERRDCVGQRGKTDSDMVKLKLWNCVQEFLDREGHGERFFGMNARNGGTEDGVRTMIWPEDAQEIVKTCVPLLRRMVTNERQRRYAVETRKVGGGQSKGEDHGHSAGEQVRGTARATSDHTDNPDAITSDETDRFGDGEIPNAAEASKWYDVYNSDGVLDEIFTKSGLSRALWLPLITKIDAHCRLRHSSAEPQCDDTCKSLLIERLLASPFYQKSAPARDLWETTREAFNAVLVRLSQPHYSNDLRTKNAATSGTVSSRPAGRASCDRRSASRRKISPGTIGGAVTANERSPNSSLLLLVYIVQQDKCLLPSFHVPSSQCPNLETLRSEVEEHFGLRRLQEKGVTSLSEAALKVWLPDGLVRVEDDGQWMVALLSADTVEWMGGQVRVLLEI